MALNCVTINAPSHAEFPWSSIYRKFFPAAAHFGYLVTHLMLECDLETSTTDWVIDYPAVLRVFERLGIDYTCGGKSLGGECQRRGLDPQVLLARLEAELEPRSRRDSTSGIPQAIQGYHLDEVGDWVAELSCGHLQHVRHQPPWIQRTWVTTPAGRNSMVGYSLLCKKCVEETDDEPSA